MPRVACMRAAWYRRKKRRLLWLSWLVVELCYLIANLCAKIQDCSIIVAHFSTWFIYAAYARQLWSINQVITWFMDHNIWLKRCVIEFHYLAIFPLCYGVSYSQYRHVTSLVSCEGYYWMAERIRSFSIIPLMLKSLDCVRRDNSIWTE